MAERIAHRLAEELHETRISSVLPAVAPTAPPTAHGRRAAVALGIIATCLTAGYGGYWATMGPLSAAETADKVVITGRVTALEEEKGRLIHHLETKVAELAEKNRKIDRLKADGLAADEAAKVLLGGALGEAAFYKEQKGEEERGRRDAEANAAAAARQARKTRRDAEEAIAALKAEKAALEAEVAAANDKLIKAKEREDELRKVIDNHQVGTSYEDALRPQRDIKIPPGRPAHTGD